jgi:hypothetical protein
MPIAERTIQLIRHQVASMTTGRSLLAGLKTFDKVRFTREHSFDKKWAAMASKQAIAEGSEGTSLVNVLLAAGLSEGEAVSEAKENLGPGIQHRHRLRTFCGHFLTTSLYRTSCTTS